MKRTIKTCLLVLTMLTILFVSTVSTAYAAPLSGNGISADETFEDLSGDGTYLGQAWRDNYALDTEKTDILDAGQSIGNSMANLLFTMYSNMTQLGLRIFHFAVTFDVTDLFNTHNGNSLNSLQERLTNSIYQPLFLLGFAAIAWQMIKQLMRRNVTGLLGEICKVLGVTILSVLLVTRTADVLSAATGFTRDLGLSVVAQINNVEDISSGDYAAQTAGVLWSDLIHRPWLALEFQGSDAEPSEADVQKILAERPNTEARQEAVDKYREAHEGSFDKSLGWQRLPLLLLYFVPFLLKLLIYIACSAVMILSQVLAIFYVLLGPLFLILAMFDTFGGMGLLTRWGKKIIETQISVLITTILLGLLILIGSLLAQVSESMGWLLAIFVQSMILVVAFMARKPLMRFFGRITNSPRALPQALLSVNAANVAEKLQHQRVASRAEYAQHQAAGWEHQKREQEYAIGEKELEVKTMQAEKLQREKDWDEAHPRQNPHDRHYHHHYRPRSYEEPQTEQTPEPTENEPSETKKAYPPRPATRPQSPENIPPVRPEQREQEHVASTEPARPSSRPVAESAHEPETARPQVATETTRPATTPDAEPAASTPPISGEVQEKADPRPQSRRPTLRPEPWTVGEDKKEPWEAQKPRTEPWGETDG